MRNRMLPLALLVSVAGCAPSGDSELVTLVLPRGDVLAGKRTFEQLRCHTCHSVTGSPDLPLPEIDPPGPDLGRSLRGVSRGAIASAIITPQHVNVETVEMWTELSPDVRIWLGPAQELPPPSEAPRQPSRMREYAEVMTLRELTDLVTYLHHTANPD